MESNAVAVSTQIDERLWRQQELGEEPRASKILSVGIQSNESFARLEDEDGDLLPGLPNDITLNHIVTKLPWKAFHVLSSVRRRWQQAIRSHKVHDARVRSHSTDKLLVVNFFNTEFLTLYATTDGDAYELPCIPPCLNKGGLTPLPERCISLDGKIYVLGGVNEQDSGIGCREVYVLDVAGQREWRKCASMKDRRDDFGYGTKDGQIYVFGGKNDTYSTHPSKCKPVCGCEVYDPEKNSWSQIAPMEIWRHGHKVANLGEELVLSGGYFFGSRGERSRALVLEAYHPIKNEWRKVGEHPDGAVFMAEGKFHVMTADTIEIYDHEKNTWSHLHSIKLGDFALEDEVLPDDVAAINGELLVALMDRAGEYHLFRGKGLGGKNTEILFCHIFRCQGLGGKRTEISLRKKASIEGEEATFPCMIEL